MESIPSRQYRTAERWQVTAHMAGLKSPLNPERCRIGPRVSIRRGTLLVLIGSVSVGLRNCGCWLTRAWVRQSPEFSEVSSVFELLLVMGTAVQAAVSWVVAPRLVRGRTDGPPRPHIVDSAMVSVASGIFRAAVLVVLLSRYPGLTVQSGAAITIVLLLTVQVGFGRLQVVPRLSMVAVPYRSRPS